MKHYFAFICLLKLVQYGNCIDYDSWLNIRMEHTLNCGVEKFCPRGIITLKSIRAGTAAIEQEPFNSDHIEELKQIADTNGFYSVKTIVSTGDNVETEFLSSMKAKEYLENGLSDVVNAWILPNAAVTAVTFQVANSSEFLSRGAENKYKLNTNFYLRYVDQAPVPDTASYIQKLEREREAREKGEMKDNRSFLAKYWMYIVPIAIFVMVSGATNPEPAQAAR